MLSRASHLFSSVSVTAFCCLNILNAKKMQNTNQSSQALQIFENAQFGAIRTAGTSDEPQFCLADVCKALDLSAKGVKQRLSDEVISNYPITDNLGRQQTALFVNEDGLYDVILDSRMVNCGLLRHTHGKVRTARQLDRHTNVYGGDRARPRDVPPLCHSRRPQAGADGLQNNQKRIMSPSKQQRESVSNGGLFLFSVSSYLCINPDRQPFLVRSRRREPKRVVFITTKH